MREFHKKCFLHCRSKQRCRKPLLSFMKLSRQQDNKGLKSGAARPRTSVLPSVIVQSPSSNPLAPRGRRVKKGGGTEQLPRRRRWRRYAKYSYNATPFRQLVRQARSTCNILAAPYPRFHVERQPSLRRSAVKSPARLADTGGGRLRAPSIRC